MASSSKFGLGPEARDSERRRARREVHYPDESGARPLPTEKSADSVASYRAYEARQRDAEALDEEVELPGVSRHAGLLFGIGVGLGIAVLATAGGLYLGGYVGRAALAAGPETTEASADLRMMAFDDAQDARALELASIASVLIDERTATSAPTQTNSADIQVVDEASAPSRARQAPPAATSSEPEPQVPASSDSSGLSNELDELQQSLRPRGPAAPPREPSNVTSAPESSLPPPAEPTAPAETTAPESTIP